MDADPYDIIIIIDHQSIAKIACYKFSMWNEYMFSECDKR